MQTLKSWPLTAIYQASLGLIFIITPWLQHRRYHDVLQVLHDVQKKRKYPKSLVSLQALIYTESFWPVCDIPSGLVFFLFPVVFLPPPLICCFSAKSFYPCPVTWLYLFFPFPRAADPSCRCAIPQHCSGCTSTLLFWWLPTACLISANPALPLWLFTGPSSSSANRCHFCLLRCWTGSWLCEKLGWACAQQRIGYFGDERGEVQNANFCLKIGAPQLVCK